MLRPLIQTLTACLISQEVGGVLKGRSRPIEWILGGVNGVAWVNCLVARRHEIGGVLVKEEHVAALLHIDTTLAIWTDLVTYHDRHHCIEFADIISTICSNYSILIICQI